MAAHGGLRHLQNCAEFRDRQLVPLEQHEHATARRIRERRHVVQDGSNHLSVNPDIRLHHADASVNLRRSISGGSTRVKIAALSSMPLGIGDRLGRYEITTLLGRGGMGEVYRARDSQLKREVAIKQSAAQFTDRFRRESEAVAALNHPNICTLYDVGPDHLVMELVEGPTLAERMAAGPLPLNDAFAVARQIADALEHAHSRGIIHRDLKPANVKVRPDGTGKVLDFGLAKLVPAFSGLADSETTSTVPPEVTQAGVILGTAAYMSPEQAAGQDVDKRSDIWAFGVVLYEMLSGKPLFQGDTALDTLARVRLQEPDWTRIPERARVLLKWCLEKNVAKRLRDIGDARLFIDDNTEALVLTEARPTTYRSRGWIAVAAVVAVVVMAVAAWLSLDSPVEVRPLRISSLLAPEGSESTISLALARSSPFPRSPPMAPDSCLAHARPMEKRPSYGSVRWIRRTRSRCQVPKVRAVRSGRRIVAMSPSDPRPTRR